MNSNLYNDFSNLYNDLHICFDTCSSADLKF